jgi:hypothetical protein
MRLPVKTALITLAIEFITLPLALRAVAASRPVAIGDSVSLLPERVFAPSGFNDQDHAQLTFKAALPDTCYGVGPAKGQVDPAAKRIELDVQAIRVSEENCAYMEEAWIQTLDLGQLAPGNYEIFARDEHGLWVKTAELPVDSGRNPLPVNMGYAIMDRVWAESGAIVLQGRLPSPCTRIQEIQTNFQAKNVIEVVPLTWTDPAQVCDQYLVPFEIRVPVRNRWKGDTLLHVRSQGSPPLNQVVNL